MVIANDVRIVFGRVGQYVCGTIVICERVNGPVRAVMSWEEPARERGDAGTSRSAASNLGCR